MARLGCLLAVAVTVSDCGGTPAVSGSGDAMTSGAATGSGGDDGGSANTGNAGVTGGDSAGATVVATETDCLDFVSVNDPFYSCGAVVLSGGIERHLLIVLDKSSRMLAVPEGFEVSLWEATRTSLLTALEVANARANYGLVMFPYSYASPIPLTDCGSRCCELPTGADTLNVEMAEASTSVPLIAAALQATEPGGATPTALALSAAYDYYVTGDGASLPSTERYVMLLTASGPNCNEALTCDSASCTLNLEGAPASVCDPSSANCCDSDYASSGGGPIACLDESQVLEAIQALANRGVKTFVVGLPGSEAYQSNLTEYAKAGQVPDPVHPELGYYAVAATTGDAGLLAPLQAITKPLLRSCDIKLNAPPIDANDLFIGLDCVVYPATANSGVVNWVYNHDDANPAITLLNELCETVESQGVTRIDLFEGCLSRGLSVQS